MPFKYRKDILDDDFIQLEIPLEDDSEGRNIATLIRLKTNKKLDKAVLYIHGFNDYFFQKEFAYKLNEFNVNFYALDLRKYGRSYLSHQKFNDVRNIYSYFEEINKALAIIHQEGNTKVTLIGHSTGGLIVTIFAKHHMGSKSFHGIILNSPFFKFNLRFTQRMFIPLASFLGRIFPKIKISGGFTEKYGQSIHKNYSGEWEYDLKLKPNLPPKVNLGWIRAVHKAQNELKHRVHIDKPILVLHSARSVTDLDDIDQISSGDSILNIKDIQKISNNINGDIEIEAIKGGLHDLILSRRDVRDNVYNIIFAWMKKKNLG